MSNSEYVKMMAVCTLVGVFVVGVFFLTLTALAAIFSAGSCPWIP